MLALAVACDDSLCRRGAWLFSFAHAAGAGRSASWRFAPRCPVSPHLWDGWRGVRRCSGFLGGQRSRFWPFAGFCCFQQFAVFPHSPFRSKPSRSLASASCAAISISTSITTRSLLARFCLSMRIFCAFFFFS